MHEKLVKQLRNAEHCSGCPYDEDCNEFDSCLMDLLAADAIEDMNKRITRLEKELKQTSIRCEEWMKLNNVYVISSIDNKGDHVGRFKGLYLDVNGDLIISTDIDSVSCTT